MLTVHTSPAFWEEKAYAMHVVLGEILGIPFRMEPEAGARQHRLAIPDGREVRLADRFADLQEWEAQDALPKQHPHLSKSGEKIVCLFGDFNFHAAVDFFFLDIDLFAAAFFMLSRVEEKRPELLDEHGRFPARHSLAFRAGFLDRPVVNEWADLLFYLLQNRGWQQPRLIRKFQVEFSCDVDHPRLWWTPFDRVKTLAGALLKRRDRAETVDLLTGRLFRRSDPYDVWEEWFPLLELQQIQTRFNFLGERPRTSDCWYPLRHPYVRQLMQKIADNGHSIGFHPSYEAFNDPEAFQRELASLREVSPVKISGGRQHYLRFEAPRTWRMWQEAGLSFDSTLGYPDAEGFRCGICHDFPVFDTEKRVMLPLRERPLLAMDVTLALYRRYTPEQALTSLLALRGQVEKHGGNFSLLWHNSSWNTVFWEPWKGVMLGALVS